MATSSIFAKVCIDTPENAEAFIDALEASAHESEKKCFKQTGSLLTDLEAIRGLLARRDTMK